MSFVDHPKLTNPPQPKPDIASPVEAMEYLTQALRNGDFRMKVHAAAGIVNYHLASEIAGLINILTRVDPIGPDDAQPGPRPEDL